MDVCSGAESATACASASMPLSRSTKSRVCAHAVACESAQSWMGSPSLAASASRPSETRR
eukprot:6174216-Pleurochrysis_carterae.AAC.2